MVVCNGFLEVFQQKQLPAAAQTDKHSEAELKQ